MSSVHLRSCLFQYLIPILGLHCRIFLVHRLSVILALCRTHCQIKYVLENIFCFFDLLLIHMFHFLPFRIIRHSPLYFYSICFIIVLTVSKNILFAVCGCELKDNDMSTVPYGIYMARKVHQNNDLSKIQQIEKENEKLFKQCMNTFFARLFLIVKSYLILDTLELNPMKYNSKMMNSIWGMYNRYSVHNLKKIMDDDIMFSIGNQQK